MYKRDVAIVLLSCVSILISLQHDGSFSFRKAWYHHLSEEGDELYSPHKEMPPPVVADLNGDGQLELVMATPDLNIQVVMPQAAGKAGDGFAPAKLVHEVSLQDAHALTMQAVRRVVSLSVGYIDPLPVERVRPPRKQVIVVITAAWQVLCYDHNLKLLWKHDARERFPHHARIKEVAVYISPHQVQTDDRGLIVVGASIERGDVASGEGLEEEGSTLNSKGQDTRMAERRALMQASAFGDDDVLMGELQTEEEEASHRKSAGDKEALSDLDAGDAVKGVDLSRHFNYLALEGSTGNQRWSHSSADFHRDLDTLSEELRPQNDYRLDAAKLAGRHFGEASCREYRASLLKALPHTWSRPSDTRLIGAHFVKHKALVPTRSHAKKGAAEVGASKGQAMHAGSRTGATRNLHAAADHSLLGGLHSRVHGSDDHRGSGRHKAGQHAGAEGSGVRQGSHPHANITANALVAHLEEGIEVLHLFTGRTLCKLHLLPHTLHADINGDGVVDHVTVPHGPISDDPAAGLAGGSSQRCVAVATSGIPPNEPLFQVPVCRTRKFGVTAGGVLARAAAGAKAEHIELLPPVLLPIPEMGHGYSHATHRGILAFLSSKGEVTAVLSHGEPLWQAFFAQASWPITLGEVHREAVPTLLALPLRSHALPSTILASGATGAVILSEHGHVLNTIELPFPALQPLLAVDYNGDGLTDLILVTSRGVYGYSQIQHLGGFTLSALLLTLILAMGLVYLSQHMSGGGGGLGARAGSGGSLAAKAKRAVRSTDYVD